MYEMTARQREIKELLDQRVLPPEIAKRLGVSRNAIYQQIQRMRKHGVLPADFTPTGQPVRELPAPGAAMLTKLLSEARSGESTDQSVGVAGTLALYEELRRTRDDLDGITRRLSALVPR